MTDPVERVAQWIANFEEWHAADDWKHCAPLAKALIAQFTNQGIDIAELLSGKTAPVSMEFLQAYDLVEEWQDWTGEAATAEERKIFERKLLKAARQSCPGPEQYLAQPETAWPKFDSSKPMDERQK